MEYGEYKRLYDGLNGPGDFQRFLDEGYDKRLLDTMFNQKTNRYVRKNYHRVRNDAPKILNMWKSGSSFCEIADKYSFPPILIAMTIFLENGTPRKTFWDYVRDPSMLYSAKTAAELSEAAEKDLVYSPDADILSKERGKWGEGLLWEWLDAQGVKYQTEEDERDGSREQGAKTPDCLLDAPMDFCGQKIRWIESKASFGDGPEFRINSRKQLIPYTEKWGQGVVVYWTGHLDGLECPEGVILEDKGILEKKLKPWSDD